MLLDLGIIFDMVQRWRQQTIFQFITRLWNLWLYRWWCKRCWI